MQSVQTFGRKVCADLPAYDHPVRFPSMATLNVSLCVQKNAVAVAYAKQGKGVMRLNGVF